MIEVRVPGDKSLSHRALIFSALSDGECRVRRILRSADIQSTAGVLRTYGVQVPSLADDIVIRGVGLRGLASPASALDCGNSGTTARLMLGVAAALPFASHFIGDESLSRRPMRRVTSLLEKMGARFGFEGSDGLPLTVHGGPLQDFGYVNERASAQIKSALLLAGLLSGATVRVVEPRKSRDHTEMLLAALGASIERDADSVTIRNTNSLSAFDFEVPADPSSAAFLAAYAALSGRAAVSLPGVCLNPTRVGFLNALRRMNAELEVLPGGTQGGEPVGAIVARGSVLTATSVVAEEVPSLVDELPLLACVAARADGETVVRGAEELRVKESDRIKAIVDNLRAVGAHAEELSDGFVIRGSQAALRGRVTTHADHRIAMAFGVLGAVDGNSIEIDDPDCVGISYPDFWRDLQRVAGG